MKHPIYRDAYISRLYSIWKNDSDFFKEQARAFMRDGSETVESISAYMEDFAMMESIERNGMVVIEANRSEWDSKISKKTLSKMKIGDIKLPFHAGAITSSTLDDGYMLFSRATIESTGESALRLQIPVNELPKYNKESSETNSYKEGERGTIIINLLNTSIIGDSVSEFDEDGANYVYSILSIFMYISLFKNDSNRVKETRLKACSASRKKGVPKHRVNKIVLRQKISKSNESIKNSKRGILTKSHIVRGHWRNQWYPKEEFHKPKWIDPYWKGDGKEELEKIYKV